MIYYLVNGEVLDASIDKVYKIFLKFQVDEIDTLEYALGWKSNTVGYAAINNYYDLVLECINCCTSKILNTLPTFFYFQKQKYVEH